MRLAIERQRRVFAFAGSKNGFIKQHCRIRESSSINVRSCERLHESRLSFDSSGRAFKQLQPSLRRSQFAEQPVKLNVQAKVIWRFPDRVLILSCRLFLLPRDDPQPTSKVTVRDDV